MIPGVEKGVPRTRLSEQEIDQAIAEVAWSRRGDHIERTVVRPDFRAAVALVNQIADLAEELDHHPDMTISWNRVALSVTTHDAGGLTALDFDLARRVDALVEAVG